MVDNGQIRRETNLVPPSKTLKSLSLSVIIKPSHDYETSAVQTMKIHAANAGQHNTVYIYINTVLYVYYRATEPCKQVIFGLTLLTTL